MKKIDQRAIELLLANAQPYPEVLEYWLGCHDLPSVLNYCAKRLGFFEKLPRFSWIAPRGMIYGVDYAGHSTFSRIVGVNMHDLEDAGWMHVSDEPMINREPTRAQLRSLELINPRLVAKIYRFESPNGGHHLATRLNTHYLDQDAH